MISAVRTGVVVQMRLDSKRLPGKALLAIGGTTLAGLVMRRLRGIAADEHILATDIDGASALAGLAEESGFAVFAGPKDDVLARYAMVAEAFGLGRVIRATGDNPFVSLRLASLAVEAANAAGADYVGLVGMPVGMGIEVVGAGALLRAAAGATSAYDREHVCPYLYGHPGIFSILRPECPARYRLPEARVSVDTGEDFRRVVAIIGSLGPDAADDDVLAWLKAERKDG